MNHKDGLTVLRDLGRVGQVVLDAAVHEKGLRVVLDHAVRAAGRRKSEGGAPAQTGWNLLLLLLLLLLVLLLVVLQQVTLLRHRRAVGRTRPI